MSLLPSFWQWRVVLIRGELYNTMYKLFRALRSAQRFIFDLWGGETAPQIKNKSLRSAGGAEESAKFAYGVT